MSQRGGRGTAAKIGRMIPEVAAIADPKRRAEADRIIKEICKRLDWRIRPVVTHLPEHEIQHLFEHMAWFKYKHEGAACLRDTPAEPISAQRGLGQGEAGPPGRTAPMEGSGDT